jgi:iron complex outermembrane receptor protein
MFRQKPIVRCLAFAFGGGLALSLPVHAQQQQPQKLERVEITGSAIKRVNAEGPVPVEIYTRKDIERTRATNVNELLRSISSIDIFDQGELASNSPAGSGTANVKMRGLSENNVLVLLNGRRLPVNALYDSSGAGAAVDVNLIPISIVERIEILKDGGSAIYGADAVAGVINIITKKNSSAIEARASYGVSKEGDGEEKHIGAGAGFGDYDKDGFNVLIGVDHFKREPIFRKDRPISSSADFRRFGGPDARSSFSPSGNIIDPNTGAFTGDTMVPCPEGSYSGGRCRYDFSTSLLTAYNGADRLNGMVTGSFKLSENIRAFGELLMGESKDRFDSHPAPDIFVSPAGDLYFGRFMQGGPRVSDRKSTINMLTLGLEGNVGNYDWRIDAGQGRNKVTNSDRGYLRDCPRDAVTGIFCEPGTEAGTFTGLAQAGLIDPTSTNNDPALVDSVKIRPQRVGESTVTYANSKFSGELTQMANGPLAFAVGASWWKEELSDSPDPLTQQGLVLGSIQQAAVNASRKAYGVFGELNIPVLKNLEAQAAVRYDHYPTADATSPKLALRYVVMPALSLRASYTKSFRAPSLKQLYGNQEEGAADFVDPALCAALNRGDPNCTVSGYIVNGSNANLKPEKGTTYNLGVVFEPNRYFNGSLDFWRINKTQNIGQPTTGTAISQGLYSVDQLGTVRVFTNLLNFAETLNEGIDLDLRMRIPDASIGAITFRNATTYYTKQRTRTDAANPWAEFNGTYALPRIRNTFFAELERGPWTGTMAIRYVGRFTDTDQPNPPAGTPKVGSYEEVDLALRYAGIKNLQLDAGVKNVFDKQPPFSFQNAVSNQYTQLGFAELYSMRGRFFFVGANYQFR